MIKEGRYAFWPESGYNPVRYRYHEQEEVFCIYSDYPLSDDQYKTVLDIMAQDLHLTTHKFTKMKEPKVKLGKYRYSGWCMHWQDLAVHWREE